MSIAHLLNKTMTVERSADTQDSEGSVVRAWTSVYTSLPCRQRQLSARERTTLGREMILATHRFYCDSGKDIRERDRILFEGEYYDVDGVNNPHLLNRHIEIDTILRD